MDNVQKCSNREWSLTVQKYHRFKVPENMFRKRKKDKALGKWAPLEFS
jgi:hypothetical protein